MSDLFPFQGLVTDTDIFNKEITEGASNVVEDLKILKIQINNFLKSKKVEWMVNGNRYYDGYQDILKRKRTAIGEGGRLHVVENLPNNQILDNQYAKIVDQKVNYQVGKPLTISGENDQYVDELRKVFNKKFHRKLKNITTNAMNMGISYMYVYYNDLGELDCKVIPSNEFLPFWKDEEHTELEYGAHVYTVIQFTDDLGTEKAIRKVDLYTKEGIEHYVFDSGQQLIPDVEVNGGVTPYIVVMSEDEEGRESFTAYNWSKLPIIPFKFNNREIPLIVRTKSLQDAINEVLSDFQNNMQEDKRNTILVIKNYGGQDLGEFRQNLATYGAVKVETYDGIEGGVDALTVEVNSENYRSILDVLKRAIIENGRGYDFKSISGSGTPNQITIRSMYSDIELDANGIETEFQASLEEFLWFVNRYLETKGLGNFDNEQVDIIFNRDTLINESEVIDGLEKSTYLSLQTRIEQHPYTSGDPKKELDRLKKEQQEYLKTMQPYEQSFEQLQASTSD